ncbi:MAG: hypothetical protein ABIE22_00315 [archaeon]
MGKSSQLQMYANLLKGGKHNAILERLPRIRTFERQLEGKPAMKAILDEAYGVAHQSAFMNHWGAYCDLRGVAPSQYRGKAYVSPTKQAGEQVHPLIQGAEWLAEHATSLGPIRCFASEDTSQRPIRVVKSVEQLANFERLGQVHTLLIPDVKNGGDIFPVTLQIRE